MGLGGSRHGVMLFKHGACCSMVHAGNGQSKPVDVKNLDASQIEQHVSWLRSSHGRSQDYKVTSGRHLTRNPSIQGMWTVDTFAAQLQRRNEARLAAVVVSSAARE